MAGASAFHTRSVAASVASKYSATGAGRSAVKIVPGGQITSNERNHASEPGSFGSVIALNTVRTPETSPLRVQFTGPGTCGWVPVKSATTRSPSISTRTRIGNGPLPSPSSSMKSSASNTPRGRRATAALASASLRSCAARIAAVTSSTPYRRQISSTRRSATSRQAANAVRSPIVMSGRRLFAPMIAVRSRSSSPPRATRTNGSCSPSWKISTESAVHEPGSLPPTSVQWPFAAANATISSFTKIGLTIATSER